MGENGESLFHSAGEEDPADARDQAAKEAAAKIRRETDDIVEGIRRATPGGAKAERESAAMDDLGFYGDRGESRRPRSNRQNPPPTGRIPTDEERRAARARADERARMSGTPPVGDILSAWAERDRLAAQSEQPPDQQAPPGTEDQQPIAENPPPPPNK